MAETVEGRPKTKGNSQQASQNQAQDWRSVEAKLLAVRTRAKEDKKGRFHNLLTHVNDEMLLQCFRGLERGAAAGSDGVTKDEYAVNLEKNVRDLVDRVHSGKYRAKPSRRVMIPKEDGSQRPLGIACLEDKLVQAAEVEILSQIYEEDFLGFSYGFRPGRGQHDALDALHVGVMSKRINWVLDLDISKFFDTVNHEWMMKFLEHRVSDRRVLKLIQHWLTAGILDEHGHRVAATVGTPQGAVISPLLANVYLHYSFDLWFHKERQKKDYGDIVAVRYADDCVLGFEKKEEAEYFLEAIKERLGKFGLQVHPVKTKIVCFGKLAFTSLHKEAAGTFDFLGFTHYMSSTRKGAVIVKRKTRKKRLRESLKEVRIELRKRMHRPKWQTGLWLKSVVRGHMQYFAVPFNFRSIQQYIWEVKRAWFYMLNRRGQKGHMSKEEFFRYANQFIPKARIIHPYPNVRFAATHPM